MSKFLYNKNQPTIVTTKRLKAIFNDSSTFTIRFIYFDKSTREWIFHTAEEADKEFELVNKRLNG